MSINQPNIQDQVSKDDRNYWFKYLFFPALKNQLAPENIQYPNNNFAEICSDIKVVADVIIKRTMRIIDPELYRLERVQISWKTPTSYDESTGLGVAAMTIANFIASFCQEKSIYWDDVHQTSYSAEEILNFKKSLLGKALAAFKCFISDVAQQTNTSKTSSTIRPTSHSSNSGSLLRLNNAAGLVHPAKKEFASQRYVYWIKGYFFDTNAKTNPRVHVSPLNGANPLKVKYKSGQGFDDCILYFFDYTAADAFLIKVQQNCKDPKVDATSFRLKKVNEDSNGYFQVNTEFGSAYIAAKKLHEMLEAADIADAKFKEDLAAECDKLSKMSKEDYYKYMADFSKAVQEQLD